MKIEKKDITDKQMSSMHIAYRQFAEKLNEAGYTLNTAIERKLLKIDIPFTEGNVKEIFGYAVLKSLFPDKFEDDHKPKHPRLSTTETQLAFEVLNNAMAHKFGVSIPFPAKEDKDAT